MDLNTVTEVVRRPADRPGAGWRDGDAWLAGGTWLFSVEQPDLRRLVDLTTLGWEPLTVRDDGLDIAATCTIRDLYAFQAPDEWTAAPLVTTSCEAFLASFKIWNSATVGGNICMSLPAGPMITLTVALDATYTVWTVDGGERTIAAADFVTGNNANVLAPGEILRSIRLPATALRRRHAHRRFSLTHLGRSTVFLVGTRSPGSGPDRKADHNDNNDNNDNNDGDDGDDGDGDGLAITITAGTTHPVHLVFEPMPDAATVAAAIEAIPADTWFDDPNGTPAHRRHLAGHFAEQIRTELANGGRP